MLERQFIAKTRNFKDLIICFQWVNEEPAMCILRKHANKRNAWVICLSSAYKYDDDAFLVESSVKATMVLGSPGDKGLARNFCDAVMNNIDELVKMKPEPKEVEIARIGRDPIPEFDARNNTIILH